MTDIVKRLRDLARVDNCQASLEAARTIEILRVELAKVNMENDRLTRTNRAKREHRDKLLEATSKQAAEIERLRAENKKLRAALKPFADAARPHKNPTPDFARALEVYDSTALQQEKSNG